MVSVFDKWSVRIIIGFVMILFVTTVLIIHGAKMYKVCILSPKTLAAARKDPKHTQAILLAANIRAVSKEAMAST
jgi:hypothetical protein